MTQIKIKIKAKDKKKYRIKEKEMDFADLEKKIRLSIAGDLLEKTVKVAEATGLSKMSQKEIDAEIKAYRKGA